MPDDFYQARAHAGLDHPNVVRLLDFGRTRGPIEAGEDSAIADGTPFLVTEYAFEGTAAAHRKPTSWPTLRHWLLQVLDGLAFTHARGVFHRDIKPENMLLFDGEQDHFQLKLSDNCRTSG